MANPYPLPSSKHFIGTRTIPSPPRSPATLHPYTTWAIAKGSYFLTFYHNTYTQVETVVCMGLKTLME